MTARILQGDCLDLMREMPSDSFDSIVTDPPAGIGFMGAAWDGDKGGRKQWTAWLTEVLAEALRVVKPGGHALVWALPRTSHWTGWAAEEAGWESRDVVHHCFWSGMPKGGSIGPALDRLAGAKREVVGQYSKAGDITGGRLHAGSNERGVVTVIDITAPATPDAAKWEGWHTHLKPAVEHWHLLRKPLGESTIARNVLKWGTGALNIDGCRIPYGSDIWPGPQRSAAEINATAGPNVRGKPRTGDGSAPFMGETAYPSGPAASPLGRYPANLVHFKKPSRKEKEAGCEALPSSYSEKGVSGGVRRGVVRRCPEHNALIPSGYSTYKCGCAYAFDAAIPQNLGAIRNHHPTPKSVAQMRYLCRLVTPPGGHVLDMFGGSGGTGIGAKLEGFDVTLCELDPAFVDIARARIKYAAPGQEVEGGKDPEPVAGHQPSLF